MYQALYLPRCQEGECRDARQPRRHKHRAHQPHPREDGVRHNAYRHPHPQRGYCRCRCIPRSLKGQCPHQGYGTLNGKRPHCLCPCQSRARDYIRGCNGEPSRRPHEHRPKRLSQPDKQRHRFPVYFPWSTRRGSYCNQRGDETCCGACHRRPCKATCPRGRKQSIQGGQPLVRARLLHTEARRPASACRGFYSCSQGCYRERCGT